MEQREIEKRLMRGRQEREMRKYRGKLLRKEKQMEKKIKQNNISF